MEKFNDNLKIFLISILIAGWGVDCSPSFANFPGFREGGNVPPVPPWSRYWRLMITYGLGRNIALLQTSLQSFNPLRRPDQTEKLATYYNRQFVIFWMRSLSVRQLKLISKMGCFGNIQLACIETRDLYYTRNLRIYFSVSCITICIFQYTKIYNYVFG